jgi:hypothetical protein
MGMQMPWWLFSQTHELLQAIVSFQHFWIGFAQSMLEGGPACPLPYTATAL